MYNPRVPSNRFNEISGPCSTHGKGEKCIQLVVRKTLKEKKPIGVPRTGWEDNIKMNLVQCVTVWNGFNYIGYQALVETVMKLRVP
jgi:hypothetical protein